MKKMTIVALAAMLSASMALAGMGISWDNGEGAMIASDGDLGNWEPGGAENNAVLWQLIYAGANNAIDDIDLDGENYLSGDDELIASRLVPAGGGDAGDGSEWSSLLMLDDGSATYVDKSWSGDGDYVYQRLFEGETPTAGMYYFETDLFAFNKTFGAAATDIPDSFGFDPEGEGVQFDKQIASPSEIPEPATMSLLGLGALAMVIRRKLRK